MNPLSDNSKVYGYSVYDLAKPLLSRLILNKFFWVFVLIRLSILFGYGLGALELFNTKGEIVIQQVYVVVHFLLTYHLSQFMSLISTGKLEGFALSELLGSMCNGFNFKMSQSGNVITALKAASTNFVSLLCTLTNLVIDLIFFTVLFVKYLDPPPKTQLYDFLILGVALVMVLFFTFYFAKKYAGVAQLEGNQQTNLLLNLIDNFKEIALSNKLLENYRNQLRYSKTKQSNAANLLVFLNGSWLFYISLCFIWIIFRLEQYPDAKLSGNLSFTVQQSVSEPILLLVLCGYSTKVFINYLQTIFSRSPSVRIILSKLKESGLLDNLGKENLTNVCKVWSNLSMLDKSTVRLENYLQRNSTNLVIKHGNEYQNKERDNLTLNQHVEIGRTEFTILINDFEINYFKKLIKVPSAEICNQSPFMIEGNSGIGKTTFIDCLSGLNNSWSGEITFKTTRVEFTEIDFVVLDKYSKPYFTIYDKGKSQVNSMLGAKDTGLANEISEANFKFLSNLEYLRSTKDGKDLLDLLALPRFQDFCTSRQENFTIYDLAYISDTLSMGENSRLVLLSRLDIKPGIVFILDELLSSVEEEVESEILELVGRLYPNAIFIFTSHRKSHKKKFQHISLF